MDSDKLQSNFVEVEGTVPNICIGDEKWVADAMRGILSEIEIRDQMKKEKFSRKSYNYKCVTCSIPL